MRIRGLPQALSLAALTVGTLEVTGAATFAETVTATGQFLAADGSAAAPSYSFAAAPTWGFFYSAANSDLEFSAGNSLSARFAVGLTRLLHGGVQGLLLDARNTTDQSITFGSAEDLSFARLGAASARLGKTPSATPINQTFTVGEASRPGTDTNVGGANGTIRSGLGTGTGTASSLFFQVPTLAASGSGAQTYATMLQVTFGYLFASANVVLNDTALIWNSRLEVHSPADGVLTVTDGAGTSFGRLCFGGTSASFPALRRSGAVLEAVKADESDYATFRCSAIRDANNVQVLGAQGAAVADATGAGDVVAQLNTLLARLRAHGLIST